MVIRHKKVGQDIRQALVGMMGRTKISSTY